MIKLNYNNLGQVALVSIFTQGVYVTLENEINLQTYELNWDLISYEPTRNAVRSAWEDWVVGKDLAFELRDRPDKAAVQQPVVPNWQELQDHLLGGTLFDLYQRVTASSFVDPSTATLDSIANANNISTASGKISDAITNNTVRIEPALAMGINLLKQSGYIFTPQEIKVWNTTIRSLNFSSIIEI